MTHRYLLPLLSVTVFLLLSTLLSAQPEWQWAKRWGGAFNNVNLQEEIDAMVVDHEGNVYISCGIAPGFFIGDSLHQNYGGSDNMLISFDCDGNVRWHHIFGNGSDNASTAWRNYSIAIDSNYLYYAVEIRRDGGGLYKFMDSMFAETSRIMIAKFDHDGNWLDYEWVWPGGSLGSVPFDIYTRNDTLWLLFASQAGTIQGQVVTEGFHVGILGTDLNLIDVFTFGQISNRQYPRKIVADESGNIIIGGWTHDPLTIGGQLWEGGMYLLKLDAQGQVVWIKGQEGPGSFSTIYDVEISDGHIYIGGWVSDGVVIFNDTISYFGGSGSVPFVGKIDGNGNLVYYIIPNNTTAGSAAYSFTKGGDKIYFASWTAGTHTYDFTQVNSPGTTIIYIIEYDEKLNTGSHFTITGSSGLNARAVNAMTHDENGNIFMAGRFAAPIYVGNDTLNKTGGGDHDLFVAKYGVELCVDTTGTGIGIIRPGRLQASAAIHPHPVRHSATLTLSLPPSTILNDLHLQVFDMQGRQAVVPAVQWHQGNGTVSGNLTRGELPQGLYLWRVVTNGEALASGKVMFVD